ATGALTTLVAAFQAALTLAGSRQLSAAGWLGHRPSAQAYLRSTQFDLAAWIILALAGALMVVYARRVASGLERHPGSVDPARARLWIARATWVAAGLYVLMWWLPLPWPQTARAALVIVLAVAWAASTPGRIGRWLRGLALGLIPETRGRG